MSVTENLNIARKTYELFNKNDYNSFIKLFTENPSILSVPGNQKFVGKEGIKKSFNGWKKAFSDARVDIKNMIANDEYVVTEFNGSGTHDGVFETPMGKISPTRKKVNLPCVEILKLKNGKIDSVKQYFDSAALMEQLGISMEKELVA